MAKEYPVEIDLGRKETANEPLSPAAPRGTKAKPRVVYPVAYIDSVPGLDQIPKEGCMMIKYRRKSVRLDEDADGKEKSSVAIEIRRICLPDDYDVAGETLADAFAKLAKGEAADDGEDYTELDDSEDEE